MLARWDHPLTGIIAPDRFIGIAEEHNLIGRLSDQVVRKALAAAVEWDPALTLSINISPRQFTDSWLAQKVVRLLAETGFPAERLVVESHRKLAVRRHRSGADDRRRASRTRGLQAGTRRFRDAAFRRCRTLSALPFDKIKIDRSFVASIGKDRQSAAIVRAVTTMAQALDINIAAAGLYTPHTLVVGGALRLRPWLLLSADVTVGFWSAWDGPYVQVSTVLPSRGPDLALATALAVPGRGVAAGRRGDRSSVVAALATDLARRSGLRVIGDSGTPDGDHQSARWGKGGSSPRAWGRGPR